MKTLHLHRRRLMLLVVTALALSWAPFAAACPVCFGEAEAPILDGARLAVVFMAVLVYLVLMGALFMVLAVRRKVRKTREAQELAQDPHHGLRLVPK